MKKRVHVCYSGRVQGVGFRFFVRETARRMGIVGWVKNLRNGSVEIIAEADEEGLKQFLREIERQFGGYIRDTQAQWLPAGEDLADFEIGY